MNRVINVENIVCSEETLSRHAELYHYTDGGAFDGIVRSQTLWCSNFRKMLDRDEISLMRKMLPPAIAPRMDTIIREITLNREWRRSFAASGGSKKLASDLVNSVYAATFDGKAVYSALDAYLFSFSTHAGDTEFDREHGIRSQWTSYAGPAGYCLVFDTSALARMLALEMDTRYWIRLALAPVRYADQPVEDIFPELVEKLANTLRQFICGTKTPEIAVPDFLSGATLLKSAKYKSEREIRIVAIPGTTEMAEHAANECPNQFDASAQLPCINIRSDTDKRYVALFDGLNQGLPIKRVIVGPGEGQQERFNYARSMLGDVPVTISLCSLDN